MSLSLFVGRASFQKQISKKSQFIKPMKGTNKSQAETRYLLATLSCGKSPGHGCSTTVSMGAGGQQRNPSHTAGQQGQQPVILFF